MSIIFVLLLIFLGVHNCSVDKGTTPVHVVTDKNVFAPNITESDNFQFTSIGTGTPIPAALSANVVPDTPDGKSSKAPRFIPALSGNCRRLLGEYAVFSSLFMHCSIMNAKPLFICETCVAEYQALKRKFSEIEKSKTCAGSLLSSDRVQILRETHKFAVDLWTKGNCASCFKDMKNCNSNVTKKCQVSAKVSTFKKDYNATLDCFKKATDVCSNCSDVYCKLSEFYKSMGNVEEICMDCVELMNSTRKEWSTIYNCTYTRKDVVSVVAISIFFCSLPLFFYIGSKVHTVKTEHKLMKQNRLKPAQRPQHKIAALPVLREAYITNDTTCNSL